MMLKRVFILMAAVFIVATMVYGGGKKEKGAPVAASTGEPQYGGTLNVIQGKFQFDPPSPDMADGHNDQCPYLYPMQEQWIIGDFEKYGPRGSGEYGFQVSGALPQDYWIGNLLEDWEVTPKKLTLKVRKGIHWAPNEQQRAWMEPRELVADDLIYYLEYFRNECPAGKSLHNWTGKIKAIDRYTFEIEFKVFNRYWAYDIAYEDRSHHGPPEMFKRDPKKWENQLGTGPFMFKEYVRGSHFTYSRNPNYWKKTVIDGKEYKYPFVDEMTYRILPDESTRVAAVRTGRVDYYRNILSPEAGEELEMTTDITFVEWYGRSMALVAQVENEYLSKVEVRRALMRATDIDAHMDLYGQGRHTKNFVPLLHKLPESIYTPIEKMPPETQKLYDYNPQEAKKMLADAGYPNGFKVKITLLPEPAMEDHASLVKDRWKKIGVEAELEVLDQTRYKAASFNKNFPGLMIYSYSSGDMYASLVRHGLTGAVLNYGNWSNADYDRIVKEMLVTVDDEKHNRLAKKAGVIAVDNVLAIPLFPEVYKDYYWPWVRNFYGEINVAEKQMLPVFSVMWIDQNMKKSMGF